VGGLTLPLHYFTHTSSLRLTLGALLIATANLAAHAIPASVATQQAPAQTRQGRGGDMLKDLNRRADQKTKVEALMKEERGKGSRRGGQSGPTSDADR
jgi:Spy/CpxP family protein refolding chaperone